MGSDDLAISTQLVGIYFNTFLYGLAAYQFATYYRTEFNDHPVVKYMVLFLSILDTIHSTSVIYMAWYWTVMTYHNRAVLVVTEWPYIFTPVGTALAALVTQLYLGFRIWRLTRSNILYGVVILLATSSFILAMICSIEAWSAKVLSELTRIVPVGIAWLSMQVVVNTFITTTLVITFARSRIGFCRTDTVPSRLIRGAIQTGLVAGVFSMGDLVTYVILPNTNLFGMFAIPIGRIYTNTLLDTLLVRESLKAESVGAHDPSRATTPTDQSPSIQLKVQKTVEKRYDLSPCEDADGRIVPLSV